MYGDLCKDCGNGIVRPVELHNLRVIMRDITGENEMDHIVPKAIIGICNKCMEVTVDYNERLRWLRESEKIRDGEVG